MGKFTLLLLGSLGALLLGHWLGRGSRESVGAAGLEMVPTPPQISRTETNTHSKMKDWPKFTGSPAEFIGRYHSMPTAEAKRYFLFRTLDEMAPGKLPGLAAELGERSDRDEPAMQMLAVVEKFWTEREGPAALAWARTRKGPKRALALTNVLAAMAVQHPSEAVQAALALEPKICETALSAIISQLAGRDPLAALAMLKANPGDFEAATTELFHAWAETDPAAAVQALGQLPSDSCRASALAAIFPTWIKHDPNAAPAGLTRLSVEDRHKVLSETLSVWSADDPLAASQYFLGLPKAEQMDLNLQYTMENIAKKDPALALKVSDATGTHLHDLYGCLTLSIAQRDFPAALDWINSIPSAKDQAEAISSLQRSVFLSPEQLAQAAQKISNPENRKLLLAACLTSGDQLAALLPQLPAAEASDLLTSQNGIWRLGEQDPLAAAALLTTYGKGANTAAWAAITTKYAQDNPAAAYAWASTLPAEVQAAAISNVLQVIATKDSADALKKASAITDPALQQQVYADIATQLVRTDPAALNAVLTQLPPAAQAAAQKQLLAAACWGRPAEAGKMILEMQSNGSAVDSLMEPKRWGSFAENWATLAPQAAADWSQQLTDGKSKNDFVSGLAKRWAEDDPMSASVWIRDLPTSSSKDAAIGELVHRIQWSDPTSAIAWAGAIQDETQRLDAYKATLTNLIRKAPAAGRQAIEAAPIPAELKAQLLQGKRLSDDPFLP